MGEESADVEIEDRDKAKEAIHYALNSDYCVLEFNLMDDNTIKIGDITEHHQQLEKMVDGYDPADPLDQ